MRKFMLLCVKGGLLGCMGVGVPFAIGAKTARPEKDVVLITAAMVIGGTLRDEHRAAGVHH